MIAPDRQWKPPCFYVCADSLRYSLGDTRDEPRALDDSHRRIVLHYDVLKLVMSVEDDIPAEILELVGQSSIDEMDGTLINTRAWLATTKGATDDLR